MYTTHGQHIPGTMRLGSLPLGQVVACGGPDKCESCAAEVSQVEVSGVNPYATQVAEKIELLRQTVTKYYLNSRERSIALTKLDETELWLTKSQEVEPVSYLVAAAIADGEGTLCLA